MANKLNHKNLEKLRQQSDLQEQATVKNSLAGFYNATENSFSGVIILDDNFNIAYLNEAAAQNHGFVRPEIADHNFWELINCPKSVKNKIIKELQKGSWSGKFEINGGLNIKNKLNIFISQLPLASSNRQNFVVTENKVIDSRQAEERLKQSEDRFKLIFKYAPDTIYLSDLKGTIIDGNNAAEALTGYKKSELIGNNFFKLKLIDPSNYIKIGKLLAINAMGKPTGPDEFLLIQKDGTHIIAEVRTYPVKMDNKIIILGIVRNITEKKAMESRLAESEAKYRALIEGTSDIIYSADLQGNLTYISPQISKYGYQPKELIGQNLIQYIFPDDRKNIVNDFQKTITTGQEFPTQFRLLIKNQKGVIPWFEETGKVVKNSHNKIIGINGIIRDITERKNFIEKLQVNSEEIERQKLTISKTLEEVTLEKNETAKEKEKLFTTLNSIGDGVIVVDKEQKVFFLNPVAEEITGWPLKQAKNQDLAKVFNIFDEGTMKKRKSPVAKALKTGQISKLANHTIIKRKDGQIIPISDSAAPIRDAKKKIFGAVLVFRDVIKERIAEGKIILAGKKLKQYNQELDKRVAQKTKELSKALEELKSLDALKDEFLNISAHELKTPLTSIIGLTELMLLKKQGNISGLQEKSLRIVNKESTRLLNIIRKILDITRIEAKRAIFDIKAINPCEVLPGVVESLKTLAKNTGIQIICNQPHEKFLVKADFEKLNEVVYNLIDNALKFSPENGKIFVTGEIKDQEFIFSVKDQGPGIDPESKKRLFQKFSQLDTGFSRQQEGTGLGLYISKIMIEGMGGKIWVESELGKGATFKFSLPLADNKNAS